MSWGWGIAMGIIAVLLSAIVGVLYNVVMALNRVDDKLGKLEAHPEQAKLVSGNITAQSPVVAISSLGLRLNPRLRRH